MQLLLKTLLLGACLAALNCTRRAPAPVSPPPPAEATPATSPETANPFQRPGCIAGAVSGNSITPAPLPDVKIIITLGETLLGEALTGRDGNYEWCTDSKDAPPGGPDSVILVEAHHPGFGRSVRQVLSADLTKGAHVDFRLKPARM